mgnify:CR=1 FL=1
MAKLTDILKQLLLERQVLNRLHEEVTAVSSPKEDSFLTKSLSLSLSLILS